MLSMRTVVVLALVIPALASAQSDPTTNAFRRVAAENAQLDVAAADAMPADKYSFKPTAQQMSFAESVIHTWDTNRFECAAISGRPAPAAAKLAPTDSKAVLVAALKSSFDFCKTALAGLRDADLATSAPFYAGRAVPKGAMVVETSLDWGDHYAILAMYLRLNGVVPPSAR